MKFYRVLAAGLAASVVVHPAFSETLEPNAVIVTATRTAQTADETLAAVTVITRADIEQSQAKDVAELLRFHAGIDIGRTGGPGQTTSVFIRGTDSNHALVLIDGVKINPGTIGQAALQNINPGMIEKIEIVRGPRSTLYGSDAIGGVIQIFTRRGAPGTTFQARAGAGADDTRDGGLAAHYRQGSTRAGFDFGHLTTDGFPARVGGAEDSGHRDTSVNIYGGLALGSIDAELSHWQASGNGEFFNFDLTPADQDFINTATTLTLKATPITNWVSTLKLAHMRDEIDQNQIRDFAHTRRSTLDLQNDVQLPSDHLLSLGLYFAREKTEALSFGTSFDVDTDSDAVFVQDQWHAGDHQMLGAVRYNDHATFGSHTTGELAYGYRVSPSTRFRASVATGFRAPDSTDRFGFGANPDLDPETSRNFEFGARLMRPGGHTYGVTFFRNDIDDLIAFVGPFVGGMNQNIDRVRIQGVELSYELLARPWSLNIETVLQDPKDRDTGDQLLRRAKRSLTAAVRYAREQVLLGLDVLATGKRSDIDFETGDRLTNPGYGLVNFLAQYRYSRDWSVRARVENLFDKEYTLADGFNTQDRAFFLEIEFRDTKPVNNLP